MNEICIIVKACRPGESFADFSVIMPTLGGYSVEYRFAYLKNPENPELRFDYDIGGSTNCELYRPKTAYVGRLLPEGFEPSFRVLQGGEVSFAMRELGAADFVGGIHGDENMSEAALFAGGKQIPLDTPGRYTCHTAELRELSYINRCNTPSEKIILHRQRYSFDAEGIKLSQYLEWIAEPRTVERAYTPMLTVQRRSFENPERVLTDTVELYSDISSGPSYVYDTTPFGTTPDPSLPRRLGIGSHATAARVYGKDSGLTVEAVITEMRGDADPALVDTLIWPRYGRDLDSKVYFNLYSDKKEVHIGTVWDLDISYKIKYNPMVSEGEAYEN